MYLTQARQSSGNELGLEEHLSNYMASLYPLQCILHCCFAPLRHRSAKGLVDMTAIRLLNAIGDLVL
jgi:hypothetical protein